MTCKVLGNGRVIGRQRRKSRSYEYHRIRRRLTRFSVVIQPQQSRQDRDPNNGEEGHHGQSLEQQLPELPMHPLGSSTINVHNVLGNV